MMSVKLKEDILKMRFEDIYGDFKGGRLSCREAAMVLGISERTFLRKRNRFNEEDFVGQWDRRLGKRPSNTCADEEIAYLTKLYKSRFEGFSVKHFYGFYRREKEALGALHRSYNWCRMTLQKTGVLSKGKRGGPHRQRRERKPMPGMMLHQDASTHEWVRGQTWDLVATLDDADSRVTSLFFVEQEGTASSLRGVFETVSVYGLFCSLYTDRGSHYAYTPEAGGKVDKSNPTAFGRILRRLGIQHIHAYSPQARGRSERLFATLQGRLPKELAMAGIKTMEEANRYLREVYLPRHNEEFMVKPTEEGKSAYKVWGDLESLKEEMSLREERIVQNDNTVRYEGLILQIPPSETRYHYAKAPVEVRKYLDGSLAVFYGHVRLGRYLPTGQPKAEVATPMGGVPHRVPNPPQLSCSMAAGEGWGLVDNSLSLSDNRCVI
jgi:hypothetical protein